MHCRSNIKNTAPSLDKDYAYLKSRSSEPSIAFTPSKARRAMRAELALYQATAGKTRDAKKRITSFLLALGRKYCKIEKLLAH